MTLDQTLRKCGDIAPGIGICELPEDHASKHAYRRIEDGEITEERLAEALHAVQCKNGHGFQPGRFGEADRRIAAAILAYLRETSR